MAVKQIQAYTFGMGDRFAHQGKAQLRAILDAREEGIEVFPVWNKSHREHGIVGSVPDDLAAEAREAVAALGWSDDYYIDADHIRLDTVDSFLAGSDFFTLDVADSVGADLREGEWEAFLSWIEPHFGEIRLPGLDEPLVIDEAGARAASRKFLRAIGEAGVLYRHIAEKKGENGFVVEVSIDETDTPQTPAELFYILAMIAREEIPAQTIAPKFTGRFNKGIDYAGDLDRFAREFEADILVIARAVRTFGLPETLKLSVHSGSDKFSIYPVVNRLIRRHGAGLHVKTAGTTWLEEVIGLAEADGDGLDIAKTIYEKAFGQFEELTAPYATVIDIDRSRLPAPSTVNGWNSGQFTACLRHDPDRPGYNPHFRQLIHVGFKVAAKMGDRYTDALKTHASVVGRNVTTNLLERHIRPIFEKPGESV